MTMARLGSLILLLHQMARVEAWSTEEFELFDLVEEVNQNFYDMLQVKPDVSTADVKRAYRKVCVQFHPDKYKGDDAEVKFRQCAAVYEVLKDEERRKQYDDVLEHGLPNWRQPVFYYRRVRKMGLVELSLLLTLIITVGQYIVAWSVYWERRFTLMEVFKPKRKSGKKKGKGVGVSEEELLSVEMASIPRPHWSHLWPIQLTCICVTTAYSLPLYVKMARQYLEERNKPKPTDDEEEDLLAERELVPRPCLSSGLPLKTATDVQPVVSVAAGTMHKADDREEGISYTHDKTWSDDDFSTLTKLMIRYPGGMASRWERIAETMRRDVNEVTKQAKYLKTRHFIPPATDELQDHDMCQDVGVDLKHLRQRRKAHEVKTPEPESYSSPSPAAAGGGVAWSQREQKLLEQALQTFPRGTANRWEMVAGALETKSAEECMQRVKEITDMIRKKKTGQ